MDAVFRSVGLKRDRCKGCVACIKRCPTEAIRIRNGKAHIIEARCIDCGECIRVCPNHAKFAITNRLDDLNIYKFNIAMPAPSLFSQFDARHSVKAILCGLLKMGFDDCFEVAVGAEIVAERLRQYLKRTDVKRPVISNACPACVRLLQICYPELIGNLLPYEPPVEVAAKLARERAIANNPGLCADDIGVWFIGPCPAKMTAVVYPLTDKQSNMNGVISISAIYSKLRKTIPREETELTQCEQRFPITASWRGLTWGVHGGESDAVDSPIETRLVVHGIHHVKEAFEQLSDMKLRGLDHIEVLACESGCVGGVLTVQNRFIGEHNLRVRIEQSKREAVGKPEKAINKQLLDRCGKYTNIETFQSMRMDEDMTTALRKVELMERILKDFPGLDCGSCGSPTCKVLAEDIAKGFSAETDCIFKLRERVRDMAKAMVELSEWMPPSFEQGEGGSDDNTGID